jgi:transposase
LASVEEAESAFKKKSLHASERDTEANRKQREEFITRIATIDPKSLVFLDESGVTTSMTRLFARSEGGGRIYEAMPDSRWKILTIIGAMSLRGMIAMMTIEEATDGDIFRAYVEQVLCAALQPGDVMVMDNLSSHKVSGVREMIEKVGAEVLYLPPYSPDLNPIEKAWSKDPSRRKSKNQGSSGKSHRRSDQAHYCRQRHGMVQSLHRWSTVIPKTL